MSIDIAAIGRELKQPGENIKSAIKLLDDGNTISFITRFRKDQTGGLNEEQLLEIKTSVARMRALADRKSYVVKSIQSQDRLTDEISQQIDAAQSIRQLEDIYLPFKPKKQTLATVARQNGLEPLAQDILLGREPDKDLATRATDFVRVDKHLNSVDEVIAGVGHILAEEFSDDTTLRDTLRKIVAQGRLTTRLIEITEPQVAEPQVAEPEVAKSPTGTGSHQSACSDDSDQSGASVEVDSSEASNLPESVSEVDPSSCQSLPMESEAIDIQNPTSALSEGLPKKTDTDQLAARVVTQKKKKKSKKKKTPKEDFYQEFANFSHAIAKMPYYKMLAINRGEKNGRLKVKVQFDEQELLEQATKKLVPAEHPFREFLTGCVKDAMFRLVVPSIEREIRREVTEAAEKHAVLVFARNLKNLLLQSPVRDHRVLAIDPGYKRGCPVVLLDSNGQLLHHDHVFVVGNSQRITAGKQKLVELIRTHRISLIAIGNGAACREAEHIVSDLISENFVHGELKYAIVNEAGASFYSTSEVGREEFPDVSPSVRGAISIGRRLIDPLSELVKISPANIGVGLYQHDVRAKHLAQSLDDVVEFCVNRVGVDVNTASPSLLKYVSGLNQLTARRIHEYRQEWGPFTCREQLKNIAGVGEATFVQAAGFLRIHGGAQPLDTTAIHPECYEIAQKIVEQVNGSLNQLFVRPSLEVKTTEGQSEDSQSATSNMSPAEVGPELDSPGNNLSPEQTERRQELIAAIKSLNPIELSQQFQVGQLLMRDILHALCLPEYDPRKNINRPVFRSGIVKLDDLKSEMCLDAQVVNVVDFGVFVDIGLGSSCLVHVSQLASHFIRDPHRLFAVGDRMRVWVSEVNLEQRRVKLTAVQPQSTRQKTARPFKGSRPANQGYGAGKFGHQAKARKPREFQADRERKPRRQIQKASKPVKPITKGMLSGSEPMRSFSDLAQFYNQRPSDEDTKTASE